MNIKHLTFLVIFICSGIISCSDNAVDFKSDEIEGEVSKNRLTIINKLDNPIYYFVVERETARTIDWGPLSTDENKINPQQNKQIELNDVHGYQKWKQRIIYYWSVVYPDPSVGLVGDWKSIKSIVVDTK